MPGGNHVVSLCPKYEMQTLPQDVRVCIAMERVPFMCLRAYYCEWLQRLACNFKSSLHRAKEKTHRKRPRPNVTLGIRVTIRTEPIDTSVPVLNHPPRRCGTHGADGQAARSQASRAIPRGGLPLQGRRVP